MTIARPLGLALAVALAVTTLAPEAEARPRARRAKRFEANKTFGLGLMVGAPTAISGKYFYASDKAFDFGVGAMRYYRRRDGLHLHVDHLWHPVSLASTAAFELPLYFGLGLRIFDFDDNANDDGVAIGIRAPIGIAFDLNNTPIDIFVELALVADFFVDYGDRYDGDLNGAVGFRYYFEVMRVPAIRFTGAGGVEVIALGELDVREPGPGEVAVEIAAAGVNRADLLQRRGLYPAPPGAPPDVPGLEFSGTVAARGPGAGLWAAGAAVMGITGGGAMARRIVVHERELMPVPVGVDLIAAAAIPEVFLTAWDAMILQAGLAAGEPALIHAVASGVGTAAVQLARAIGARPLGTSRTAGKLARVAGLADGDGLVPTDGRFAAAVHARTGGGAAVILDCVGAAYAEENLRALAPRGRLVMIGTMGGATGPVPLGMLLGKRATIIGTVLRARPLEEKIALARRATAQLVPLFERGVLTPVIDRVLPMTACAEAHAHVEADASVGKVVLRWD